jgi:hypothetical protein
MRAEIELFLSAWRGQNHSLKTLRAYGDDLKQFLALCTSFLTCSIGVRPSPASEGRPNQDVKNV